MRAFVVLGLIFPYQAKRLACGTYPKLPVLCCVGRKSFNSTNQSMLIVWRIRGQIIRAVLCCVVYDSCTQ